MELASLLLRVGCPVGRDCKGIEVSGITADSRKAGPGVLFVAVKGSHADGHDFIDKAIESGCSGIVQERPSRGSDKRVVPTVTVDDSHTALGKLLAAFYRNPASRLTLIGITGTNGKTTTAYLIESILRQAGYNPGVIGTINYRFAGTVRPAPLTTPDPEALQQLLMEMEGCGVTHVVMEVSSHSLDQRRLAGVMFDIAGFTNLSRDHLDYHLSMEAYYQSKLRLFSECLAAKGIAVITEPWRAEEADCEDKTTWAARLKKDLGRIDAKKKMSPLTCGGGSADVRPAGLAVDLSGIRGRLKSPHGEIEVQSTLIGSFNVENLLCAAAVGSSLRIDPQIIARGLNEVAGVPGRLERVAVSKEIEVFVDYAHTPDALDNVLATLRGLSRKRLLVVFGCGGDRDPGKREIMGRIAAKRADVVIVTSDNPRHESARAIIEAIIPGVEEQKLKRQRAEVFLRMGWHGYYDIIASRRQAIRTAVLYARPGDILLIAGKGHENYQLVADKKIFLDDRMEAAACLSQWQAADRAVSV
jgi:UDP-N-acetylmuramyl-tripeptide synthetase